MYISNTRGDYLMNTIENPTPPLAEGPSSLPQLSPSPGQQLRERLMDFHARAAQNGRRSRVAYVTTARELESEGVGGRIPQSEDTLSALLSYQLNGREPGPNDSAREHLYHALGQTYELALIIVDDDQLSQPMRSRLEASGLPIERIPSSSWRAIRGDQVAKDAAKARYEQRMLDLLRAHHIDLAISDSYTCLFGDTMLNAMGGRVVNIHPAHTRDLPGITPTADGAFRHGLFRRINSRENFIERDGERFYCIPLRYNLLFQAENLQGVLAGLHARRIFLGRDEMARLVQDPNLNGLEFQDRKGRPYRLEADGSRVRVLEHERARAQELFVDRFARCSIEHQGGQTCLLMPVEGERGRFATKTGATFHQIDSGIDTGPIHQFSRATPIRNQDSRWMVRAPPHSGLDDGRHRNGVQNLRERNYETKNRLAMVGLLTYLRQQAVRSSIQAIPPVPAPQPTARLSARNGSC